MPGWTSPCHQEQPQNPPQNRHNLLASVKSSAWTLNVQKILHVWRQRCLFQQLQHVATPIGRLCLRLVCLSTKDSNFQAIFKKGKCLAMPFDKAKLNASNNWMCPTRKMKKSLTSQSSMPMKNPMALSISPFLGVLQLFRGTCRPTFFFTGLSPPSVMGGAILLCFACQEPRNWIRKSLIWYDAFELFRKWHCLLFVFFAWRFYW